MDADLHKDLQKHALNFSYLAMERTMMTMKKYIFALAVMTATFMSAEAFAGVHIFYAPHPDDFIIAMGAAVREHKAAGHTVYLVLNSAHTSIGDLLDIMNGNVACPAPEVLHPGEPTPIYHNFNMSMAELATAEEREIISAAKILGVDKVLFYNYGRGLSDNQSFDPAQQAAYKQSMREMIESMEARFPGAGHKVIANFDPDPWGFNNETHRLLAEAALDLYFESPQKIFDLRLYKIYAYWYPVGHVRRSSICNDWVAPRTPDQMAAKRKALDEHFYWNPLFGHFAFGAHSVLGLIDKASASSSYNTAQEFVMVPHDYKTWTPPADCYL